MPDELNNNYNFSGVDALIPPDDPPYNFGGVDKLLHRNKSQPTAKITFQPNVDFDLSKISSIQDFYQNTFNRSLPLSNQGQAGIHNKWGLDHRNSADIGLNPDSTEGKQLMTYLRQNNIPFLAFDRAIPGVATSAHIHIGKPSKKTNEIFQIGTTSNEQSIDEKDYDFSGVDELSKYDFSNVDKIIEAPKVADTEVSTDASALPVDPSKVAFKATQVQFSPIAKAAYGLSASNRPQILGKNPDELGDPIIITKQSIKKPSLNEATDTWLNQWNPEYKKINDRFRAETGGINIVDLGNAGNIVADTEAGGKVGKNVWKIQARPTRESVALFEAVKEAYANGEKGMPAYIATGKLSQEQRVKTTQDYKQQQEKIETYQKDHPYITALKGIYEGFGEGEFRLFNNLNYLGKAMYTGNVYGFDSQQYLDLINEEKQNAYAMQQGEMGISRPEGAIPKLIAGGGRAALSLPKYIVAGQLGLGSLTTLSYLENLHRGNREAALAALPMALMEGGFHGFNEFLNSGTTKSVNTLETNSDGSLKFDENGDPIPIQKTYTENLGAGNIAPFRRVTNKDLSLFQESIATKPPITIQQLSPLGRQLLLRGTNALLFGGTALLTDPNSRNLQDTITHFTVGFGMPVGKAPKAGTFFEIPEPIELPKSPLQLGQNLITVPLTPTTITGESGMRNVGDTYLPSYETPTNKYKETTSPIEPNLEKGFSAATTGQTIQLPMDTAALNLIDLERTMQEGTWRTKGDSLQDALTKQKAIQEAIEVYKQQIPPDILDYFRKNEPVVRAALRSNYEANKAKTDFLERKTESLSPDEIKQTPDKVVGIDPKAGTAEETFKTNGANNTNTSQQGAKEVLDTFTQAVNKPSFRGQGGFIGENTTEAQKGGMIQLTKEEFDKIWNKTKDSLSYLNAFFIEDLYHRGIEPTIDLVSNRLNAALGDGFKLLDDAQKREVFQSGKTYFDTNQADPFFSKMKQDAVEKLPNRMTAEQALNVLKGHKNEFEWTVGLETFLNDKKVEKFSKQELIDIIEKGQVRVEASVADEQLRSELQSDLNNINLTIESIESEFIDRLPNASANEVSERTYDLRQKKYEIEDQLEKVDRTRYSLKAYTHEKLELPGAENSKEVKLISPIVDTITDNLEQLVDPKILGKEPQVKYRSPHWDEPNVVAHYRSNDRVTTDGIRVYHSEEFQSDWNHDLRLQKEEIEKAGVTRNLEPNPFMEHSWKELVLKRFIRDAVVAKDENGNYKYDGVTWTTARQQQERAGKILKGKHFNWRKNQNRTYTFGIRTAPDLEAEVGYSYPHELSNISLERLEELATKEAAQEVREQEEKIKSNRRDNYNLPENDITRYNTSTSNYNYEGKFSLEEAIELRSGIGKYSDYDVAFVNMAKKTGKRFGASYSEKEVETSSYDLYRVKDKDGTTVLDSTTNLNRAQDVAKQLGTKVIVDKKVEKVHFLKITPSMRESLSKEGFALYGLGGSEPLKSQEIGVRNKITTQQGFDQHRADLVDSILNDGYATVSNGTDAFNSGLPPDALIDLLKLTKADVKDFIDFSHQLISQFGEAIKPYLNDLWIQTKGLAQHLGDKFDLPLDEIKGKLALNSKELQDSVAFKIRQFNKDERGVLFLTKKEPEIIELQQKRKKVPYFEWYGLHRGIMIAQLNTQAGETYNIMRSGQRVVNAFESNNLNDLQSANSIAKNVNSKNLAETIFIGNENLKLYSNAELAAGDTTLNRPALSPEEIKAYNFIRNAQDRTLELRKQHILYGLNERATDLNNKLTNTSDPTAQLRLQNSLLDVSVKMAEVSQHYEALKNSGYISTQRSGSIAVEGEDPAFPIGDPKRRLYSQFDSDAEANNWIAEQKDKLSATNFKAYDMKKPQDLKSVAANLTPGQFEELVDSAGLNSKDPIVEQLREEVYSRFSSMGYSLKRDFIRGYDRDWKFVVDSVARQTETYGRSFYARVAGNEATKHLEATGLRDSDFSLYQTMQKYIDHEITAPQISTMGRYAGGARKAVYMFQLGYDINQLYLNALAQPVTQTYSYFSRVQNPETGERLKGLEPEKYFKDGWKLSGRLAKEFIQQRSNPNYQDPNIPQEFRDIYDRLSKEHVVSAEFNKSLLKLESEKTTARKLTTRNKLQKVLDINEHWAGLFMRAGEKTTRTHVAAEAYLVGKEKFNLSGEDLTDFIVRSIDATQSNPTRAENPLVVRGADNKGEVRKLLYQFNAFNHMWIENLALNAKADLENTFDAIEAKANASEKVKALGKDIVINRGAATIRHLYPLVLMGGIRNLPLAGFSGLLYTFLTGDDAKKRFDKVFGKDTTIEQLAMYGFSMSENLGGRLTPSAPFIDNLRVGNSIQSTLSDSLSVTNIPAVATAAQLGRGLADLTTKGQRLRGLGEVLPFKPLRNIAIAERYREQGIRTRANKTLVPRSKVSNVNLFAQTVGIAPTRLEENYDRQRSKKIIKLHKKVPLVKKIKI